jgi:hypothetical protein
MSMLNEIYEKQYYQNIENKNIENKKENIKSVFNARYIEENKKDNINWTIKCGKNRCNCSIM